MWDAVGRQRSAAQTQLLSIHTKRVDHAVFRHVHDFVVLLERIANMNFTPTPPSVTVSCIARQEGLSCNRQVASDPSASSGKTSLSSVARSPTKTKSQAGSCWRSQSQAGDACGHIK